MQKQQQKQKSQDYYIGYAQGYKDAVDDLKGWAIQKSDAPIITFDKITHSDGTKTGDFKPYKWGFTTSTNSIF